MTIRSTRTRRHGIAAVAAAGLLAVSLGACSSDDPGTGGETDGADSDGGTLTVWAWEPTLTPVVEAFEKANPGVKVDLVNAGTGNDQYTALQNAIAAGKGVPDVAQIEFFALPQFALAESVDDLTSHGADGLDGTFSTGPWESSQAGDGIYGLPMDSGPMAMFYNEEVFTKHGVEVPTTWDGFVEAARALHAADPNVYIANDTGDAGFTTSMIWQAGGQPFTVDGTTVSIDFSDEGSTRFAETWQQLISEDLLAPITSWSDEWYQGLGDGTIATLTVGAWMPANFESGVEDGAGKWRVAPMPQWVEGASDTAENGGSGLSMPTLGGNKDLAYEFMEFATVGEGAQIRVDNGAFPATVAQLEDPEFLSFESEYFGGQKINETLAQSAKDVVEGWSYLPFQVYANSIFNDTVGKAYVSDTSLADGLQSWQDASIKYGNEQGFTVD